MFKPLFLITALLTLYAGILPALAQDRPDPLAMIRAEHVMISTDAYEATMNWYQSMLGFRVAHEWTVPELPGVRLAYLELNGFVIEVVETPSQFQPKAKPETLEEALSNRGFGHLAFLAADVDAVAAELKARGATFLMPPTSFPTSGRRLTFIQDNNGNLIEFLTPLNAYKDMSN